MGTEKIPVKASSDESRSGGSTPLLAGDWHPVRLFGALVAAAGLVITGLTVFHGERNTCIKESADLQQAMRSSLSPVDFANKLNALFVQCGIENPAVKAAASNGATHYAERFRNLEKPPVAEWVTDLKGEIPTDQLWSQLPELHKAINKQPWAVLVQRTRDPQAITDVKVSRRGTRYAVTTHHMPDGSYLTLINGPTITEAQNIFRELDLSVIPGATVVQVDISTLSKEKKEERRDERRHVAPDVPLRAVVVREFRGRKDLPVREKRSSASKQIGSIRRGSICNVLGPPVPTKDGFSWYEVSCNDGPVTCPETDHSARGYVRSDQVQNVDPHQAIGPIPKGHGKIDSSGGTATGPGRATVVRSSTTGSITAGNELMAPNF